MREKEVVGGMSCAPEGTKGERKVSSTRLLHLPLFTASPSLRTKQEMKTDPLQSSIQSRSVSELLQEPIVHPELLLLARSRRVVDPDLSLLSDQRSLLLVLGSIGLCASKESSEVGSGRKEGGVGGGVERSGVERVGGGGNGGDFRRSSLSDGEGGVGKTGGEVGVVGLLGR